MKTKNNLRFELKEVSEEGTFEGLLSPYGNVDGGGDMVMPGAYKKTMEGGNVERPILWQHKRDVPIGKMTLEDRPDGLWCKGQLLMALDEAKKAHLLIKAGIVKGLSIGFESVKESFSGGVRQLKEIKLYEGSIVTFPMNEAAQITAVKAAGDVPDFTDQLAEIQLLSGAYQMLSALEGALGQVRYSDLSKEEQVSASEAIIEQFSGAYMSYLPQYIDMMARKYGPMESMGRQELETKAIQQEAKAGRVFSAANTDKLKAISDMILALIADDSGTSEDEAADAAKAAIQPEPEINHSALETRIEEMLALIPV